MGTRFVVGLAGSRAARTVLMALAVGTMAAAPAFAVSYTVSDIIAPADQSGFNGFEGYPGGPLPLVWEEDGIVVEQVGGTAITTNCTTCFGGAMDGLKSWYPGGQDQSYTKITKQNGADFFKVGFKIGSGFQSLSELAIIVMNDGVDEQINVKLGGLPGQQAQFLYFFDDGLGAFDEIQVYSIAGAESFNFLAIDSVETQDQGGGPGPSIPEPGTLLLISTGLGSLALRRRRRS
jgi:hypothetical protein